MSDKRIYRCEHCDDAEKRLYVYGGDFLCSACIDFEINFDVDAYEQEKRERIAEQQEF